MDENYVRSMGCNMAIAEVLGNIGTAHWGT